MHRRSQRPLGAPTRGKTAPNRLRRLDAWLCAQQADLIRQPGDAWYVDLGYGRVPLTTVESALHLRRLNPSLPVLGTEIDPERVAAARAWAEHGITFRRGGFEVPLEPGERVRVLRAMNVLRQYDEHEVREAWQWMGRSLQQGGLLVEGTSDPFGRHIVVNLLRKVGDGLLHEGLLFSVRLYPDFEPSAVQAVLPKNLIHRMVPGEGIHTFLEQWTRAWHGAAGFKPFGPHQVFVHAARTLPVSQRPWLLRRGYLLWRPPAEVLWPRP